MEINRVGIDFKEIRSRARNGLMREWQLLIIAAIFCSIGDFVCDFLLDTVRYASLINIIISSLFVFGYNSIIINVSRGDSADISMMFKGIKKFFKALGFELLMGLFVFLWSLLLIVPGFMAIISYSMTYFIWVDNPEIGINEAIRKSKEMTNGHKKEIFKLFLSFIGWILLVLGVAFVIKIWLPELFYFVMSLGIMLLDPYINLSMAVMYDKLKAGEI